MTNHLLKADWQPSLSIPEIEHQILIERDLKALIIDVDGTLLPRRESNTVDVVENWIKKAKESFDIHLLSNNHSKKRIKRIAETLEVSYTFRAYKPSKYKLKKSIEKYNYKSTEIAMIGDRLFTDVLAGNKLGLYTILVNPVDRFGNGIVKDKFQRIEIKIARFLGAYS